MKIFSDRRLVLADRLGLGDLPGAIHTFSNGTLNNNESDIWLHHCGPRPDEYPAKWPK